MMEGPQVYPARNYMLAKHDGRSALMFAATSILGLSGLETHAQESARGPALEEVIVTAQRREESLQSVPIAVTPMTSKELEARGINSVAGLTSGAIPSLNVLNFAARPAELQYSIRGIGETDPSQPSFESGVALYLDGVYIARRQGSGLELTDLERIEVLRGPQGTLFGRNAVGGAVNMVSKKPTGELDFKTTVDYGNFDYFRTKTTLNTPKFADISLKLDYLHSERGSLVDNVAPGQEDFGWYSQNGYRIAARWQPTDSITVDYAYDDARYSFVQNYNQLIHNTTIPNIAQVPDPARYTSVALAPYVELDRVDDHAAAPGLYVPASRTEVSGHALTAQWQISEAVTLKSISSYRDLHDHNIAVQGFGIVSPVAPTTAPPTNPPTPNFLGNVDSGFDLRQHQIAQEFQLVGATQRFQYTAGALYFREQALGSAYTLLGSALFGSPAGFTSVVLPSPVTTPASNTTVDSKSTGVYGQATWTPAILSDRMHITGGLRYSADDKTLVRVLLNGAPSNIPVRVSEHRVDPAATVAFDLMEDMSIYGRYATAYRGGGSSLRETPYSGDPIGFHGFGPEKVKTYELGFKSEVWDHRVRANAALFYSQLDGHQISLQTPAGVASTRVFNLTEPVYFKGAEVELTVIPLRGLTLSGGVTWLRKQQPPTVFNPTLDTEVAFQISQYPANRYSASIEYAFPRFSFGELAVRVDATGSSSYCFNDVSCVQYPDIKGGKNNDLVNGRITLSDMKLGANAGELRFALWGKNLADKKYYAFGFTAPGVNTGIIDYGEPRTYGGSVTYEF